MKDYYRWVWEMCRKDENIRSYSYFPAVELEDEISIYPFLHKNIGDYIGDSQRCTTFDTYDIHISLEDVKKFSREEFMEFSVGKLREYLQAFKNNFLQTRVENKQRFSSTPSALQFNIIYVYKEKWRLPICLYTNRTTLRYKVLPYLGFFYEGFFQPY